MEKFKAIATFLRVVEAKSFAQAAHLLRLTPSAVSKSVSALEAELGVQLLKRSTRTLSLTQDGAIFFYERCRKLFNEYDAIEASLRGSYQAPQGRLRVDIPIVVARFIVLPALAKFLNRYPQVQLELDVNDRPIDLIQEGYDAVVRIGKLRDSRLLMQSLATIRLFTNDPEALINATLAGIGIHQTASFTVANYLRAGTLKPILTRYSTTGLPVSLLYPKTSTFQRKCMYSLNF